MFTTKINDDIKELPRITRASNFRYLILPPNKIQGNLWDSLLVISNSKFNIKRLDVSRNQLNVNFLLWHEHKHKDWLHTLFWIFQLAPTDSISNQSLHVVEASLIRPNVVQWVSSYISLSTILAKPSPKTEYNVILTFINNLLSLSYKDSNCSVHILFFPIKPFWLRLVLTLVEGN